MQSDPTDPLRYENIPTVDMLYGILITALKVLPELYNYVLIAETQRNTMINNPNYIRKQEDIDKLVQGLDEVKRVFK